MWKRNNGQGEADILHNIFTKYLVTAVQRRKWDHVNQQIRDLSIDNLMLASLPEEIFLSENIVFYELPVLESLEDNSLFYALKHISERERYIFFSRVLENKSFDEMAAELDLSYKGVAAIYYRSIQKIKKYMKGKE